MVGQCNLEGMSMNNERKNSADHFRMQSEREQTLMANLFSCGAHILLKFYMIVLIFWSANGDCSDP